MKREDTLKTVIVGGHPLRVEDVVQVALGAPVELSAEPAFRNRIEASQRYFEAVLKAEGRIYGVTTGYGDSCTVDVPPDLLAELPIHLSRYHGCGLGAALSPTASRAVLLVRLNSLAQGYSGVRWALLEQIAAFLKHDINPVIPEEGSVGASGDLTPLSYVAATLMGEREVWFRGERRQADAVLIECGLQPLILAPKEALAIMNGTAVMTALACLAWSRAEYFARLSCRLTAMASYATLGNAGHFDPRLFAAKPHVGQQQVAAWIFADRCGAKTGDHLIRLQDRYSIRCAPHVIGVLYDALPWMRRDIETELNSANDNPLIDGEAEWVLHGGHFYGGHIAFAMDSLKNAVANVADLLDRQLALMVDERFNHGLPQNLSGAQGRRAAINHGFKAVQIGASAWTAEALKLTMPASVFSRSTECHNQDKVSMGTISTRDALRVLELSEQVAVACLLAGVQAIELRDQQTPDAAADGLPDEVRNMVTAVRASSDFVSEDRPLEADLRQLLGEIAEQHWPLYQGAAC